jgi:hypothetical protein
MVIITLIAATVVAFKVSEKYGNVAAFLAAVAVMLIGGLLFGGDAFAVINALPSNGSDNCNGRC